ncbi:bifunctional diguanylate cyclase/phosphodiesterase [Cocleimonas flava]|uniref:Diguanylate cyclase (GGDEF)-like protein n=1 Tax=Cocleimonas flava TaxID=634765 RepID=A0A4R1EUB2_9GAMM|nr:bifunctional diguanylate cyclase/phosphodiesterase [Cocleimonas flava]TCJ85276.1 diguanylate cyclase (GGDEF)-like protein [Cocleimonas flava]
MKITQISSEVKDAGLSAFWQFYAFALFATAICIAFFTNGSEIKHFFNILLATFTAIPLLIAIFIHKKPLYPWGIFVFAILILVAEDILSSLPYLGFDASFFNNEWLKEIGIGILSLFSLSLLLRIESNYRINGFAIDFILCLFSVICFLFILSPNLLQFALKDLTLYQQLQFSHAFLVAVLIGLLLVNLRLLISFKIKDLISAIMILTLSTYLLVNAFNSIGYFGNSEAVNDIEWFCYKFAGVLAFLHILTENYNYNYDPNKAKVLGLKFLWSSSILALLVTPIGVIYRWKFNLTPLDPYLLAIVGATLSLIVILRISVLLRNYEKQRKKLKSIAFTDALTGLPNYLGIRHLIDDKENMLVFTLNIEDFKSINDMHERQFGDNVLISLGKRLKNLSDVLFVARIGSDSFLAVFQAPQEHIYKVYAKLQQELGIWDMVSGKRVAVPLTFGASHSKHPIKPEKLVRQSELALKEARELHKDFTLYKERENPLSVNYNDNLPRLELREILQSSIDQNYLPIHFQPIYNLKDGSLKALELLIRVQSDEHGLLRPSQFLDQAKAYGLLTGLTKVCINMVAENFEKLPKVDINVNVPPYMLNNTDTLNEFISSFHNANLPTERFCIEVTEDGDIPTDHLIPAINLLKANGFSISIDDFGTGYSSLGRLSILPVDSVKIDRSLLLSASDGNKAILESAISLVKRLGVKSVVEGVETLEQLNLVRSLGADSVQGYLFSKPVRVVAASKFSLNASSIVAEF